MADTQQERKQILEISRPTLQSNERVLYYQARATSCKQDKGHVGTKGPFVGFDTFNHNQWHCVLGFIRKFKDQPYCSVHAGITSTTIEVNDGRVVTVRSIRYHDVFLKDDSLL
jgi:hypothetical protein